MKALFPSVASASIGGIAAIFLSQHYGASAMLFALLLGMAMNFLGQEGKCVPGIRFCAVTILRIGVALLLPLTVILSVLMRHHREPGESRPPLLTWFAVFALLVALGWKPVVLMVAETLFLAGIILAFMKGLA